MIRCHASESEHNFQTITDFSVRLFDWTRLDFTTLRLYSLDLSLDSILTDIPAQWLSV